MMYFGENESFFHNIQHSKSRLLPFKARAFIVIESVTLTESCIGLIIIVKCTEFLNKKIAYFCKLLA